MLTAITHNQVKALEAQQPSLPVSTSRSNRFYSFLKHHSGQIAKGVLTLGGLALLGSGVLGSIFGRGKSKINTTLAELNSKNAIVTGESYFPPRFIANNVPISQGKNITLSSTMLDSIDREGFLPSNTLTIDRNTRIYVSLALTNNRLATGQADGAIYVWNLNTDTRIMKLVGHTRTVRSLALLSDGLLVSGSHDKTIRVWNLTSGSCIKTLEGHSYGVSSLVELPGKRLASGSWDKTIFIWDLSSWNVLETLEGHSSYINSLAILSGNRMASGSYQEILIWNLTNGNCIKKIEGDGNSTTSLAVLSDDLLASGRRDSTTHIWNITSGSCIKTLEGHHHWVHSLAALSNDRLASGSYDATIRIWNLTSGSCIRTLEGHKDSVSSLMVLSDDLLASGSYDTTVRVWNLTSGNSIKTLEGRSDLVYSLTTLSDGLLASGNRESTIRIWNLTSGSCIKTLERHNHSVFSLATLLDERLASGSYKEVCLWDLTNENCTKTLEGDNNDVASLAVLSDERLASGSYKTINIWNVTSGSLIKTLEGHNDSVYSLATLSNDILASGSYEDKIYIWNLTSGSYIKILEEPNHLVTSLAALAEDQLASGSSDKTVRIWNVTSGKCIKILKGHNSWVESMALLSDGRLASADYSQNVYIWDLNKGTCPFILDRIFGDMSTYSYLATLFDNQIASSYYDTDSNLASIDILFPVPMPDIGVFFRASEIQHGYFTLGNGNVSEFTKQQLIAGKLMFVHDGSSEVPSGKLAIKIGTAVFSAVPINFVFSRTPLPTSAIVGMGVGIPGFLAVVAGSSFGIYKLQKFIRAKKQAQKLEGELEQRYRGYIIPAKDLVLGKTLGSGASGTAYLASWKEVDVVVKKLHTGLTAAAIEEFQKEASIMAQLHHPNIVRLYGVCIDPNEYGMVMEYMPEGSLDKVLADTKRKLLWSKRWQISLDISLGISYLHERTPAIVHRDLKSLNIFVDENLRVKVGDFGLAKVKSLGVTVSTGIGGSPVWMDPELLIAGMQGRSTVATTASDIYSLGILFWEIAARQIPYQGMNLPMVALLTLITQGGRLDIPKGTPPPYAALIKRCWAELSEERPRIGEVVQYLKEHQEGANKNAITAVTTTTTPEAVAIKAKPKSIALRPIRSATVNVNPLYAPKN